jgi:hypothetical protein
MPNVLSILAVVITVFYFIKTLVEGWPQKTSGPIYVKPGELGLREPMHLPCNNPSPDGSLHCRQEVGHGGWHSHHGPVSWYCDQWAEDDHENRWGNIPW